MEKLAWHFDFHSHRDIRIGHDPDVGTMAETLAAAGVEEIITFAKCHTGFAYYPSKVGTPHPKMAGDAFGAVVEACKVKGIRVLAYISFGIDGEAGRKHPEWAQVHDPAKGPHITADHFVATCPYTPYIDELMLPMIQEILDGYPVDGFFFDTMGAMGICHCEHCRQAFRDSVGGEIPLSPADPKWGAYGAFRRRRAWRVVERVGRYITDRKPEMKVGFNWVGTSRFPERMPEGVSCLTCDYSTTGPQSLQASFHAAYGKTADRPCDVMYTVLNRGWADWAPRPLSGLEQTGATIWAHGCRPYLGDRLHPANRLDPLSVQAIEFMGRVQARLARAFPGAEAHNVSEVLIVIGPQAMYGADMSKFAADRSPIVPVQGMHRLLLDAGYPAAIAAESFLAENLEDRRLVILSECEAISAETERCLKTFVKHGGSLLVTGRLPLVNGRPLEWVGVVRDKTPWQDHIYLPPWQARGTKLPVLVHGEFHRVTPAGADVIHHAIQPYDCSYGMRFGHGTGPASPEPSEVPALTRLRLGRGEVWYLEAAIGSDYDRLANYWEADWLRSLLERAVPDPAARIVSEAGTVEIVPYCGPDATWAILINHGGEQMTFEARTARTFPQVPPYPVELRVTRPDGRAAKGVFVRGTPVAFMSTRANIMIPLVMDTIWKVVRVDWE